MAKKNGQGFALESGSKQFFACPRLDITGSVSIEHLLVEKVYSSRNEVCQKCGVCKAFLMKIGDAASNGVPNMSSRGKVRPHGWRATHKKTIKRVSSGMGG